MRMLPASWSAMNTREVDKARQQRAKLREDGTQRNVGREEFGGATHHLAIAQRALEFQRTPADPTR